MALDLSSYINSENNTSTEKLQEVVARMRSVLIRDWKDLDYSPSSIFGNLFMTPAAKAIALYEDAAECILSDVDLTNALNGIVCDCTFLQSFLKGLGVASLVDANVTNTVRINIVDGNIKQFDPKGSGCMSFDSGNIMLFNDTYIFSFYAPCEGNINIYGLDYKGELKDNEYKVSINSIVNSNSAYTAVNYFVDIPVYGPSTANIPAGAQAAIDKNLKNKYSDVLESVELLNEAVPFEIPTNIADLIKLCRTIQPSANFSTRANISSYMFQKFPSIIGCSTTITGDEEMVRDKSMSLNSAIDIFIKGFSILPECTEFFPVKQGSTSLTFNPIHIPLNIKSISKNNDEEQLYIKTVSDFNDLNRIEHSIDTTAENIMTKHSYKINFEEDNTINFIKVVYEYDPIQEAVTKFIKSPDCQPIISYKSCPFIPIIVSNFSVSYTKSVNKFFDRQTAIDKIYNLINSLSFPTIYNSSYIVDIMVNCGASTVTDINGGKNYIPGTYYKQERGIPYATASIWDGKTNKDLGIGKRNIAYIMPREAINLIEIPVS